MTKQQVEQYIELDTAANGPWATSGDCWAFKYGMALAFLENCLLAMTPEQREFTLGAYKRALERKQHNQVEAGSGAGSDTGSDTGSGNANAALVNSKAFAK